MLKKVTLYARRPIYACPAVPHAQPGWGAAQLLGWRKWCSERRGWPGADGTLVAPPLPRRLATTATRCRPRRGRVLPRKTASVRLYCCCCYVYCRGLVAERDLEPGTELLLEAPLTCLCGPVCQQPTAEDLVHALQTNTCSLEQRQQLATLYAGGAADTEDLLSTERLSGVVGKLRPTGSSVWFGAPPNRPLPLRSVRKRAMHSGRMPTTFHRRWPARAAAASSKGKTRFLACGPASPSSTMTAAPMRSASW